MLHEYNYLKKKCFKDDWYIFFFFSSRRRHTRWTGDWSSDVCSSDLSPWSTAVALPFAMATGVGLAGGSLAARWGLRRWGAASFVALATASVVLGRLVAGRSENLLAVWFLAGALAASVWNRGRRGALAAGVLIAAAGLAEWPFLLAFLAIVGAALAAAWAAARTGRAPRTHPILRAEVDHGDRDAL